MLVELARRINRDDISRSDWITLSHGFERLGERSARESSARSSVAGTGRTAGPTHFHAQTRTI